MDKDKLPCPIDASVFGADAVIQPEDTGAYLISGIPSRSERDRHMQWVLEARKSLLYLMAHVATTFGLPELHRDIMQCR